MPTFQLFDGLAHASLRPLTALRPVADLRVGLYTAQERWRRWTGSEAIPFSHPALRPFHPARETAERLLVAAAALPHDSSIAARITGLGANHALLHDGRLLAARVDVELAEEVVAGGPLPDSLERIDYTGAVDWLERPHDLFARNAAQLERDLIDLGRGDERERLAATNTVIGEYPVFVEPDVVCEASTLDVREGPIFLGREAQVMPGCLLRGPLALCAHSTFKMGAKVYGGTTVGPHCKVGGEVQNVVFQGYANKGHDGYLGNAVIGRWCNLGADTNASNLKNNYGEVRQWDYSAGRFVPTGLQFCGLVMGDHAKCGINTMFNTGTVVGTSANVFGAGFPRAFVPDFAWGGAGGFTTYDIAKALDTAARVVARRGLELTEARAGALRAAYAATAVYRRWEGSPS